MPAAPLHIELRALPPGSLLAQHATPGDYADCLTVEVPGSITLGEYVAAFYTSAAFRPERWLLHLIGKGSGDADVRALADGTAQHFAAWSVEARGQDELLLRDFQHRTRSWLKVEAVSGTGETPRTRLYFGSGVGGAGEGGSSRGAFSRVIFRLLLPFHKIYARTLLQGAARAFSQG